MRTLTECLSRTRPQASYTSASGTNPLERCAHFLTPTVCFCPKASDSHLHAEPASVHPPMKGGQQISQQAGAAHNALIALPGIPDVPVAQLHSRVASRAAAQRSSCAAPCLPRSWPTACTARDRPHASVTNYGKGYSTSGDLTILNTQHSFPAAEHDIQYPGFHRLIQA